jgi:predicted DNA repair protein MutK
MATSLLALLDDVATILDDVSVMTKVAAKKTAGVLGDDLALNAQQVAGVRAERELPVVWAVAKGSMINKVILVPAALLISALAPWLVTPLLMIGGAFLCYEGFEKLAHRFLHSRAEDEAHREALAKALLDPSVDMKAIEKDKIKGAVRTDFVLSAEIIVISLGTVSTQPLATQFAVLASIAVIMTVGVYGLVAGIVKLDDGGLALSRRPGALAQNLGRAILAGAPMLMKTLAVVGTAAMFLVGGGILAHGIPALHHVAEAIATGAAGVATIGPLLKVLTPLVLDGLVGIVAGALVLASSRSASGCSGASRSRPPEPARAEAILRCAQGDLRRCAAGHLSDSTRSTYSCRASSADLPRRPVPGVPLGPPDHVAEARALAAGVAARRLLVERVELQQRHVVGLFRQALRLRDCLARTVH